jgi:acetyl-CoA synthetase
VFDIRDEDRYFCTADPGWITGHTYVTYGPLINGATLLLYEGGPSTPYPDRWWQLIAKYGISIFYTTPTAIRGLMRYGDAWPKRHDLKQLRLLGSVGEPINPAAWKWFHRAVGDGQCPIMDTYWQTETGMICISPLPETPLKPGSCAKPLPGMGAEILTESGEPCSPNEEGYLVLTRPFPSLARTLYKDPEEFQRIYFSKFPGKYFTGDTARLDEDGYFWVIGRSDEIIKVSGYRLGTAEVESGLVSHPAVAEAAVIGVPHDIKGNVIKAFVALKPGFSPSIALEEELKAHVGHEVGPIAKPEGILFMDNLPKTRSGKILRRLLRAKELGLDTGDVSTLEE